MELSLKKEVVLSKTATRAMGITVFVILTALGAFVRIPLPFSPVPLTLQTFFVLLGAAVLGKNRGTAAQLSYIALGAAGLPIFSGAGSGLVYLAGPTAGYLMGFVAASLFIGYALSRLEKKFMVLLAFFAAEFLILGLGAFWLKTLLGCSLNQALIMGVIAFIPGDLVKAALAFFVYQKIKSRCQEVFQ
jgi:biotin transport system substrate-specific component